MSMWAMLSAPLVLGTDVLHMSPATRATVTNPEIIAIDQDPLVKMATKADDDGPGTGSLGQAAAHRRARRRATEPHRPQRLDRH